MVTFAQAMKNITVRTENNMKALATTGDKVLDLFQAFGASRGKDIIPAFVAAYTTDRELALRVVLWGRDIRGGAGERKLFRDVLNWLELNYPEDAKVLLNKVSLLGRWDDVLAANTPELRKYAFSLVADAMKKHQEYEKLIINLENLSEAECKQILDSI